VKLVLLTRAAEDIRSRLRSRLCGKLEEPSVSWEESLTCPRCGSSRIIKAGFLNAYAARLAPYVRLASIAAAAVALACIPLVYASCRGQLYYVTDRRLVIRRKFGTVQVTTLPLDGVVEVTAFQGFFSRLLGYGDIVLSMVSGGGVTESLQPTQVQPLAGFYSVKRRLEGDKDVWQLKDAIIALRDKYVEARYLARIEDELKRIRQATEAKSAESENSLKSLYK